MDDDTQKKIDEWLAKGNEIKTERASVTLARKASRPGLPGETLEHTHQWKRTGTGRYRCEDCGAHGYQYDKNFSKRANKTAQAIVEYKCMKDGCPGWAKTFQGNAKWTCDEHTELEPEQENV